MESSKKGRRYTLLEKDKEEKYFSKMIEVVGIKCRDNSENILSWEETVAKVVRFLPRQLIPATFSSRNFFFL